MTVKQYDPSEVDVVFGTFLLSGFQENAIVEVEHDDDFYTIVKGVDGDVSRSRVACRTATITIKLMSTSKSNVDLTAVTLMGGPGAGKGDVTSILIRDRNGVSLFASSECWISKPPGPNYAEKANGRDWKLTCVKPEWIEGGVA